MKYKKEAAISVIVLLTIIIIFSSLIISSRISSEDKVYITKGEFQELKRSAEQWLINDLDAQGMFKYEYNPQDETYSKDNNMIRQFMAVRLLAEMSQENSSLIELHRKNLNYSFNSWYKEEGNIGYIYFDEKSKLGANSMALRSIVSSPFFNDYKDKAVKLANSILSLQNDDGSFKIWILNLDDTTDEKYLLTFYSGEAILALVDYYAKTNDTLYLAAAIKAQDFYIKEYVTDLNKNYYTAYVPWHTQSLNKLYKITQNKTYAQSIFILNDKLLEIQNSNSSDEKYFGRFYSPQHPEFGSPHSSSDGVFTEGLAYAYEIAKLTKDSIHESKYKEAIFISLKNLRNLQYKNPEDSEKIKGAIRVNYDNPRIRIDCTQHSIDAFNKIQTLDIF